MSTRRNALFEEVYGRPLSELAAGLAKTGIEQKLAARLLGTWPQSLRLALKRADPNASWPKRKRKVSKLAGFAALNAKRVRYKGAYRTLAEIARMESLNYWTVCARYRRGVRGDALGEPSRSSTVYDDLGFTLSDWAEIVRFADEHGDNAARRRLGVPLGAITAYRKGEHWRLG